MTDKITVDVKVHPTVREFIICTTGSDLIHPKRNDWIWLIIRQHLTTTPAGWRPISDSERSSYIKIELLNSNSTKICHAKGRKIRRSGTDSHLYVTDTLFRNYLEEAGQMIIADHLRKQFKQCFHNFVHGAVAVNPNIQQKEAIEMFCSEYDLTMNDITIDMLFKSWHRSPQKKILRLMKRCCPLVF